MKWFLLAGLSLLLALMVLPKCDACKARAERLKGLFS